MTSDSDERRAWFRTAVLPLEGELRRYAQRIAPSDVDADDLVQETFLRIMGSDWRSVSSPAAVLKTTVRNIVYDMFRRRGLVPFRPLAPADLTRLSSPAADPERTLIGADELRRVAAVVADLPRQCRRAFVLRKVYGHSANEIADQLEISVSTVEKHLARALRLCSEGLARQEQFAEAHGGTDHPQQAQVAGDTGSGRRVGGPSRGGAPRGR